MGTASALPMKNIENKQALIDSLNSTSNDTLRLKILYDLTIETKSEPDERIHYIDQLLMEAEKCKNNKYICNAYLSYMYLAYNQFDADEVFKWMKLLEPIARKEKFYDKLFSGKQCYIDMLLLKEQYELQEKEARAMLEEATSLNNVMGIITAYQCLAYGYYFTYRLDEAIVVLEKAYDLIPQCNDNTVNSSVISTLVLLLENTKDPVKWLKYLKAQEDNLNDIIKSEPKSAYMLRADMMLAYLSYLNYYLFVEDIPNATRVSKMAKQYYADSYASAYKLPYHSAQYKYNMRINNYEEALVEVDKSLAISDTKFDANYFNVLAHKAEILSFLGRAEESIALYRYTIASKDSLQRGILNKQVHQIKTSYTADKLLLEREKIQKQAILSLLIPLCIVLVLFVFFVLHIIKVGKKLHIAKDEMGRMANIVSKANVAKEKFLSNIGIAIRDPLDIIVTDSLRLSSDEQIEKDEKSKLTSIIKETSSKLLDMINNILMLSKLEAGMMKYNEGNIDVYTFIRNMAEIKSYNKKITILTTFPVDVEQDVKIDINLFTQLFDSLFSSLAKGCDQILISEYKEDSQKFCLKIQGSVLAEKSSSQQIVIQNEINRMLVEHFGGEYIICSDEEKPYIIMTLIKAIKVSPSKTTD